MTGNESVEPRHAARVKVLKVERAEIEAQAAESADSLPSTGLKSMPGVGVKTASQIRLAADDFSAFKTAGHLVAYAGTGPVTRWSRISIRGEFPSRAGNKRLKNALFHSASDHDPLSNAYNDRKRAEGNRHDAAVMSLARRRLNVLFALVMAGALYEAKTPVVA